MSGIVRELRTAQRMLSGNVLREFSGLLAVQQCGRVPHGQGDVSLGDSDGVPSVRGVKRCASVHACPTCSAKIRAGRAAQVDEAGAKWLDRGGELLFLTLTIPHDQGDDLDSLWSSLALAWSRMTSRRAWSSLWDRFSGGKPAFVRVAEVTTGSHGWHPHLHVLLFVNEAPGSALAYVEGEVHAQWARVVAQQGWRAPSLGHGVDLQRVCSRTALTRYLAKVDGYGRVAAELARGDMKAAKVAGNLAPFQLLAEFLEDGDRAHLRRWWVWERCSKGKTFMSWSVGLRQRLGVVAVTDEDLAESATGHVEVARVPGRVWSAAVRDGAGHLAMRAAQWRDLALLVSILSPYAEQLGLPAVTAWLADDSPATAVARGRPSLLRSLA